MINIIRQLEPSDLDILRGLSLQELSQARSEDIGKKATDFSGEEESINQSLSRLTALGLFSFENGPDRLVMGRGRQQPRRVTIQTSLGEFRAMPLLMMLKSAIEESRSRGDGIGVAEPQDQ